MIVLQLGVGITAKPTGPDPRLVRHHQSSGGKEIEEERRHLCFQAPGGIDEEMAPPSPAEEKNVSSPSYAGLHTEHAKGILQDSDATIKSTSTDPHTPMPKKHADKDTGSSQKAPPHTPRATGKRGITTYTYKSPHHRGANSSQIVRLRSPL